MRQKPVQGEDKPLYLSPRQDSPTMDELREAIQRSMVGAMACPRPLTHAKILRASPLPTKEHGKYGTKDNETG